MQGKRWRRPLAGVLDRACRPLVEGLERRMLLDGSLTFGSDTDVPYDTAKQWYWSDVVVSGAPTGAIVTSVDYSWKVDANLVSDDWWQLKGPGYTGATNTGMQNTGGDMFSGYSQTSEETRTVAPPAGTAVNGTWSFGVYDSYNDFATDLNAGRIDSWSITIYYTVPVAPPEIQVTGNTYNIANNDTTPSGLDGTDFGTSYVGVLGVERSFVVKNTGTGPLNIGTVTVPTGFAVTQSLMSVISAGSSATLKVRVDTTAAGTYSGNVAIGNNDGDGGDGVENPFRFTISATVATGPEIQLTGNGLNIVDYDTTPSTTDGTDFGTVYSGQPRPERTFLVSNVGTDTLTLGAVSVPAGFSVIQALPACLVPGASAGLVVQMSAVTTGTYAGNVTIANNDKPVDGVTENPFTFKITGTVAAEPEITVTWNGIGITSGDLSPSSADGTDFGSVSVGQTGSRTYHNFYVKNTGTSALTLGAVTVPAGFTSNQPPASLAAGSTWQLTVTLATAAAGTHSGIVSIVNNDGDGGDGVESPFTFAISGAVVEAPEIFVKGNGYFIYQNDLTPSPTDGTDFGPAIVGEPALVREFIVGNSGTATMHVGSVTVPSGYSVTQSLPDILEPGATASLKVALNTETAGVFAGNVTIASDDGDGGDGSETPFVFKVTGAVSTPIIDPTEYQAIRQAYPSFNLPDRMALINIIQIAPDQLSLANLTSAVTAAGGTATADLVIARTTDSQNTIRYANATDVLSIDIPTNKGAISLIGWGSQMLTLDGARKAQNLSLGRYNPTTINLGGLSVVGGTSLFSGLYQSSGTLNLANAVVTGSEGGGSGIYLNGSASLTNVVITGNTGDGIIARGPLSLSNVTVTANVGNGIYAYNAALTMTNTVIAGNAKYAGGDDLNADGTNVVTGSNCLIGDGTGQTALVNGVAGNQVGTAATPIDPMLAEGAGMGVGAAPLPGSPVIDAGNDAAATQSFDIYGNARISGAHVNIGAVETVLPVRDSVTFTVTSLEDSIAVDGKVTLREALAAANSNRPAGDAPAGSYSAPDAIRFAAGLSGTILTHGSPYQVSSSLDLAGDGQQTVDASDNDQVLVIQGPFRVTAQGLTIRGGQSTTGAGGIQINGASVSISDMVIAENKTTKDGGGLFIASGTLDAMNVSFIRNSANYGGGMYASVPVRLANLEMRGNASTLYGGAVCSLRSLDLSNVTISGNSAKYGGGVSVYGRTTGVNVTVTGNVASMDGGGVRVYDGILTLSNSTISANSSGSFGGGICQWYGISSFSGVTVTGNDAPGGGGLYQSYGESQFTSCLFDGNSAGEGAGVRVDNGKWTLVNSVMTGNIASSSAAAACLSNATSVLSSDTITRNIRTFGGGGSGGIEQSSGSLFLTNTLVAGNIGKNGDIAGAPTGFNNLIGDAGSMTTLSNGINGNRVGTHASPLDPMLEETGGLTPVSGSPAIDDGDDTRLTAGITADFNGDPRIQGAHVNIGAIESVLPGRPAVTYIVTSLEDSVAADGAVTLREALMASNANARVGDAPAGSYSSADRIEFAPGLTGTIGTHGSAYEILGSLELIGPGSGNLTIDAEDSSAVLSQRGTYPVSISGVTLTRGNGGDGAGLSIAGARATLQDIIVTNSTASGSGGGVQLYATTFQALDVQVSGNRASGHGGGLLISVASGSLNRVVVSGNSSGTVGYYYGGGIYTSVATVTFTDVEVHGNSSGMYGGGIFIGYESDVLMTRGSVTANSAQSRGGGVYNGASASFRDVVIAGNSAAGEGGGLFAGSTSWILTNVLIAGNTASANGGAICDMYGNLDLRDSTVAGNTAAGKGGGIYIDDWGTVVLNNSVVAGNSAASGRDIGKDRTTPSGKNSLIGDGTEQSTITNGVDGNLVGTSTNPIDPKFVNMAGTDWTKWDLRLQAGSPAINAGRNALIALGVNTDLAGFSRISGGVVDIGAYEADLGPVVILSSINDGAAQRSMVNTARVVFDEAADLQEGAIWVRGRDGLPVAGVAVNAANPLKDGRTWELTFSVDGGSGASLPDGIYSLVVSAGKVADLAGHVMPGDYSLRFHRLFGDLDGDRDVDAKDLTQFRRALNRPAAYTSVFDYDGDGLVNATDYLQLKLRMNRRVL